MKEFDLSDKEIRSLLQEDGLEEPSMGFNHSILSKIEAFERKKKAPAKAPKWLVVCLLIIGICPAIYMLLEHPLNITGTISEKLPSVNNLRMSIDLDYLVIIGAGVGVLWLAILFDKFLLKSQEPQG